MSQMSQTPPASREKLVYLRQWVGCKVLVTTVTGNQTGGTLTNIVFDGTRLMYIMLDDITCLNFDHILEVKLAAR